MCVGCSLGTGTNGGGGVGREEFGASGTCQLGERVEGAGDRKGDEGPALRFCLLTWALEPSPDFLEGGVAGAGSGFADQEADFNPVMTLPSSWYPSNHLKDLPNQPG